LEDTTPLWVVPLAYASMDAKAPCKTTSLLPRWLVGDTTILVLNASILSVIKCFNLERSSQGLNWWAVSVNSVLLILLNWKQ